jgi:peptidoglycan lytic transglycosylase D
MRVIARASGPSWAIGVSVIVMASWQLTGCATAHRFGDMEAPFLGANSSQARTASRYGDYANLYGPPASAAESANAGAFSVSNPRVDDFITTFQTRWRGFYQKALERGSRYLPRIERVLKEESVPTELAYLPLIESGFRNKAVSHAGAVGPWQFIRATGRRYGLRIDGYVDERRDPVKSTYAAARYLKELYAQFGDWHLSLAAYNTGEMNIAHLMERTKADDYWELSKRGCLPAETRDFVPQFLAAVQIAQAPEAYGFEPPSTDPVSYDLVRIDRSMSLKTVAKLANASVKEITELNPALHRGVTPPHGYTVRVPKGAREVVELALASMHRDAEQVLPRSSRTVVAARTHRLRKGETLSSVAKRHGVSVAFLVKANHIRNPRHLLAGRLLRIPGRTRTARRSRGTKSIRVASDSSR